MKSKSKKIAVCGISSALAIVFSYIETMLPQLPFMPPGAKLGLSNIVTMFAAGTMGLGYALVIALVKGAFSFTRGTIPGVMSTLGGVVSTLIMWILFKKTKASISFVAISGALTHNFVQLVVAYFITSTSVVFYIPFLIIFGILSGFLTGLVLKIVLPYVNKAINNFK